MPKRKREQKQDDELQDTDEVYEPESAGLNPFT